MLKVLIVEDERELLDNIASYLGSFDMEFEVLTALTGEDGLAILEREKAIDILFTDVRLPGIDGIEVVRRTVEGWPDVKIVIMTAFGSAELRSTAEKEGALKFIEKPVDLDALPDILRQVHERSHRRSRAVGGLEILDVAQFIAVARETKVVCFKSERGEGTLVFENGVMVHCSAGSLTGSDAFFDMVLWGEGSFWELFDLETRRFARNIDIPTSTLLKQATEFTAELSDSDPLGAGDSAPPATPAAPDRSEQTAAPAAVSPVPRPETPATASNGEQPAQAPRPAKKTVKDYLGELGSVEGFKAGGVFNAQGELLESISECELDINAIGMFANNALLNAQKATDQMGLGRGNQMQIRAPHATLLMTCYNESTDFTATAPGKVHFHTVVIMAPDASTAMAFWVLNRVMGKIADTFR